MASEIRVNKIINRSGLSTVTFSDTGAIVSGIVSATTFSGATGTFTGDLNVGGVLTYEDVTNIDSIGIITARAGINVSGGVVTGDGSGLTGVGLGTDKSVNTSGIITATAFIPSTGQLFNRNKIINGEFRINQRNHSGSAGHNTYTLDRWKYARSANTEFSQTQSTDTPDGFANSVKMDCIGANGSTGAGDYAYWRYHIEGQDLQDLNKGTSAAKPFTLSFYFKSDITGTFAIHIADSNNRMCNATYTVSDTNWNRYVITIPADTTGTIANNNAHGLEVRFYIIAGSSHSSGSAVHTWGAYSASSLATGHTANIVSTSHNLYLTGVQLEVGSVATPFEHRTVADELARCQRYYEETYVMSDAGTSYIRVPVYYKVEKRTAGNPYVYAKRPDGTGSGTINKAYQATGERDATCNYSWTGGTMLFNSGSYSSNTDYIGLVKIEVEL